MSNFLLVLTKIKSMKLKYLGILIIPYLLSCGSEAMPDNNSETVEIDTISSSKPIIEEKEEVKLFDMNPKPEVLNFDENSELVWPYVKYYNGTIGDDKISMILNEIEDRDCDGRYIYTNYGVNFGVRASLYSNGDSIKIIRRNNDKIRERFIGACDESVSVITGVWIKGDDTLSFQLNEQINSEVQTQVFVNINNHGDFYNTTDGIGLIPGYADYEMFNSFIHSTTMGAAYAFGEEWGDETSQVFFEDSIIIYTFTNIFNSVSTVFKEGHEPDGPEYNDPDGVEGVEYAANGKIEVSVIKNGIIEKEEIEINLDFTVNTWVFQNYIILADIESEKSVVYKWNRAKEIFELAD